MDKADALKLIKSNEKMVYRILSHLEHDTSMDGFIYASSEQDLYFTIFFALGDLEYIKFIVVPDSSSTPNKIHNNYEKRITRAGKEYLRHLESKLNSNLADL